MAQKCGSVISATDYERLYWHNLLILLAMSATPGKVQVHMNRHWFQQKDILFTLNHLVSKQDCVYEIFQLLSKLLFYIFLLMVVCW
jgi:hypothetical protein